MGKSQKYLKLGDNASTFNDPTSGLSISNKQVVPMNSKHRASKRTTKAIKSGHLEYAEEEDYNDYLTSLENEQGAVSDEKKSDKDNREKDLLADLSEKSEDEIKAILNTNDLLKENIVFNTKDDEEPITLEDLKGVVKDDLVDIITEGYVVTEEED